MYSQDNDEHNTPCYMYWVDGDTNYLNSWMQLIMPYTKSAQLCVCPSWSDAGGYSEGGPNKQIPIPVASYTTVANVSGGDSRTLSQFTKPAETIYGLDRQFCRSGASYSCDRFYWGGVIPDASLYVYSDAFNNYLNLATHMNGNNVFFVDGHAKWLNRTVPANFDYDPA
jgi:prepilin-type processing-associated H-X9-DG protein